MMTMQDRFVVFAALAFFSLSTVAAVRADERLMQDHAGTLAGCGVGNYLFRSEKSRCVEKTPVAAPVARTTVNQPVAAALQATPAPQAKIVDSKIEISEEVKFQSGKSVLTSDGKKVLDEVANVMLANPEKIHRLEIDGHTDHIGAAPANALLSTRRAEAVKEYLVSKGVQSTALNTKGFGETRPKFDPQKSTSEEWSQNRRVEFRILQ